MQQRKAYQRVALELSSPEECNSSTASAHPQPSLKRGLAVSFWVSGLLNNAGYVIMIASAKSISEGGVGLVFLANILPALVVKASAPYWFEKVTYRIRLWAATGLMCLSFMIVALSSKLPWQLFGVALTSAQGSLGEASLLALAGKMDGELAQNHQKGVCLNSFSSGTGFAGVFGFFWVWCFHTQLGLSLSWTLILAMVLVVGYLYSYQQIVLLRQQIEMTIDPKTGYMDNKNNTETTIANNSYRDSNDKDDDDEKEVELSDYGTHEGFQDEPNHANIEVVDAIETDHDNDNDKIHVAEIASLTSKERFGLVLSLWPYTIPLFTVYVAEYTLQSGTWTAIGFPVTSQKSRDTFYQYSNWMYQVGVFVSRSSGVWGVAPMLLLWAMPFLQCLNVIIYWSIGASQSPENQDVWHSPYFLYPTALYSGLLGGAVYIHGYLRICRDLPLQHREFALSATSLAECLGIVVADLFGLLIQACLYQIHHLEGAAMSCPAS